MAVARRSRRVLFGTAPSYERHRFPPAIIAHAVWLSLRFSLSLRAVEELLLERGIEVPYETLRRWVIKFGPPIARGLRSRVGCAAAPIGPETSGLSTRCA